MLVPGITDEDDVRDGFSDEEADEEDWPATLKMWLI